MTGEASWTLPADPLAISLARRHARQALAGWGMMHFADDAALIVSELVTNAVVHAAAPITLSLQLHGEVVHGEVTDHGNPWPTAPTSTLDDVNAESGRGLALVDALADRWGVDPAPLGKTVWFALTAVRNAPPRSPSRPQTEQDQSARLLRLGG